MAQTESCFDDAEDSDWLGDYRLIVDPSLHGVRELGVLVRDLASKVTKDERQILKANLAVTEFSTNIVKHGSNGWKPEPIKAQVRLSRRKLEVLLEDSGTPFNPLSFSAGVTRDCNDVPRPNESLSLGIRVALACVDDVRYGFFRAHNCLYFSIDVDAACRKAPRQSEMTFFEGGGA